MRLEETNAMRLDVSSSSQSKVIGKKMMVTSGDLN